MDREIPVSNRYIDRKMKQIQQKKHRQTLYNIKVRHKTMVGNNSFFKPSQNLSNKISRNNSSAQQNKNLQIQRQNILLFNKIANIIRDKPRNAGSRSYAKSVEQSAQKFRRIQQKLKTQNQQFQKRLSKQKSSIQNKLFYKERQQNVKYLKIIGRYPYDCAARRSCDKDTKSYMESQNESRAVSKIVSIKTHRQNESIDEIEVYRKKSKDAFVKIVKVCNSYYMFYVQSEAEGPIFKYTMPINTYQEQLAKSDNNFQKLVSKLRLTEDKTMIFQFS